MGGVPALLTQDQRRGLDARGRRTGAPLARMIREAVDAYLADDRPDVDQALDESFGALATLSIPSRDEWLKANSDATEAPDGRRPGR